VLVADHLPEIGTDEDEYVLLRREGYRREGMVAAAPGERVGRREGEERVWRREGEKREGNG
jgi:hypothetical protein